MRAIDVAADGDTDVCHSQRIQMKNLQKQVSQKAAKVTSFIERQHIGYVMATVCTSLGQVWFFPIKMWVRKNKSCFRVYV